MADYPGQRLIEIRIQEAITRGEFDDLPGKGKPLQLDNIAEVEEGMRLAFHILKNANIGPAWLEKQKDLRAQIERVRGDLRRSQAHPAVDVREDGRAHFRAECERMNRAIRAANLEVPAVRLHLTPMNCERELRSAENAGEKKDQSSDWSK
jgi:hypothetical protein